MNRSLLVLGYLVVFYNILPLILGYSHSFFKVNCDFSKKGTAVDPVCLINSNGGLRFGMSFIKEYNKIYLNSTNFFKMGNKYRQIFVMPVFDFCDYMRSSKKNPIVKMTMGILNSSAPGIMHQCPYKDRLDVYNFSIAGNYKLFPDGVYKNILAVTDDINDMVFKITAYGNVTSDIKYT